jgi:RHS repeat-associated protein
MSDHSQKVVWALDESENVWGAAKPAMRLVSKANAGLQSDRHQQVTHSQSQLNLRLPGQYFDEETGLHDNFNRTYNPSTGRYLQPDPLGYPDGPDAYLYASGDPVNKMDRLGLYQEDVHYYMTYFLAATLGMSSQDAQTLALASQYIDDNSFTWPLGDKYVNTNPATQKLRLSRYHFTMYKLVQTGPRSVDHIYSTDPNILNGLQNSEQLQALRSYAMPVTKNSCPMPSDQSLQFMGEFLHSFEDTFSHRDQNNVPIPLNAGFGHALYGEHPDFTYDHVVPVIDPSTGKQVSTIEWNVNEPRTLAMEAMVYKQIVDFMTNRNFYVSGAADKSKIVPFEKLLPVLKEFNAIQEGGTSAFPRKRDVLNKFLTAQGFGIDIPNYDIGVACTNRKANLSGLNKVNVPAAILGQDC